jgi:signal transduction histidine kinase
MRPLDPLSSIKMKLGVVILASVGVTAAVHTLGLKFGTSLAVTSLGSAALALMMVQFLARGMTSPLREMVAAAKAMARGDYSQRVRATSRDEVGELARAFNAMAAELDEVDRMRRDLIANVSHELRTPISGLQAVLENLIDGVQPPDPVTFGTMLEQVERLGRLVSQLLDLSRLESGAVPLQRSRFPVREMLEQAVRESQLGAHRVQLTVDVQPDDLKAEADQERVHQVVANLIENAVRHSPDDSSVLVSAHGNSHLVTIEVADEGPGIPQNEVNRVFERFYRTDTARSSSQGGTGLGLAIARWIVDLHGGAIRAESRQPHGCRIVVELPGTGV